MGDSSISGSFGPALIDRPVEWIREAVSLIRSAFGESNVHPALPFGCPLGTTWEVVALVIGHGMRDRSPSSPRSPLIRKAIGDRTL